MMRIRPYLLLLLSHSIASFSFTSNHRQRFSRRSITVSSSATPIDPSGWPDKFPAKKHCSKCGLCETTFVTHVTKACAFLSNGMAKMDTLENQVHGRTRDLLASNSEEDEARFGVMHEPMMLARGRNVPGAQWTGCVTGIAISMLESQMVDAVVCIANKDDGSWSDPEPIIARTVQQVLQGRGVKPSLAPSLRVLDEIQCDKSIRKLLFCGVGCSVQAFRVVQEELGLDEVYVLGTNCADNAPSPEAAQRFIREGVQVTDDTIRGYEFMQDFRVHVKTEDSYITKPYFTLPGSIAEYSIAPSCLACFDYTNALADVVVGYMAAPLEPNTRMDASLQSLTVRNQRGARMVQAALDASRLELVEKATGKGAHEKLASATVAADSIVLAMTGGEVKQNGMPGWLGEVIAFVLRSQGPKGVNFAKYSIDYHVLRNYLHVLHEWGEERANISLPQYAKDIVEQYLESDKTFQSLKSKVQEKQI